jgi:hypothetical protein
MHYTAMLAYRGMGNKEAAEREQKLFRRFKAEESSQSITAKRRLASPEENNERQTIHDHESVDLAARHIPAGHDLTKAKTATPAVAKAPVKSAKNSNIGGTE